MRTRPVRTGVSAAASNDPGAVFTVPSNNTAFTIDTALENLMRCELELTEPSFVLVSFGCWASMPAASAYHIAMGIFLNGATRRDPEFDHRDSLCAVALNDATGRQMTLSKQGVVFLNAGTTRLMPRFRSDTAAATAFQATGTFVNAHLV